jgi:AbrB family looped-hinge helix DNA binding protein
MPTSKVTSKGQVTIPIEIRRELGLETGDKVSFRKSEQGIVIESAGSAVRRSAGMLSRYAVGRKPPNIAEMKEAAAAGWANEPITPE